MVMEETSDGFNGMGLYLLDKSGFLVRKNKSDVPADFDSSGKAFLGLLFLNKRKLYLYNPKCFAIASQTSSLVSTPLSSLTIVKKPLSANSS